ncbi:FecR family protein [Pedobacter jeongneungensis]|uniref:FecR family protein n=1 Tax=Pedobacter jeongneungensis TaxID=947309 RepID=UPI0004698D78|nr:FecR family protein [Pedobacter jeongneungensis]
MEEEKFRQILDRYIAGEATPEEEAWLESAYINWNSKEQNTYSESFLKAGKDQIWETVSKHTKPSRKISKLLFPLLSAAALIIISMVGIVIYKQNQRKTDLTNIPAFKDIKPGKDRAVLVLANGTKINLDEINSGHLADQTGVSISKTADGQIVYTVPAQENEAAEMQYNTIVTPAGGQYQVNLPDGTKVWLNASSSLTFPTSFAAERSVTLKGEAYFEVSKISAGGKRIPFYVESTNQKIEVLGTHFNVNAYADESSTKTTLLEGSVQINGKVLLKPGEQSRLQGESIKVTVVNAEDYIDWKNGDFILEHNDFRSVMRKIARWYDVEVIYGDDAPKKLNLGGWISRSKNISSVLQLMEQTGKVHFKIEGRRITVTK